MEISFLRSHLDEPVNFSMASLMQICSWIRVLSLIDSKIMRIVPKVSDIQAMLVDGVPSPMHLVVHRLVAVVAVTIVEMHGSKVSQQTFMAGVLHKTPTVKSRGVSIALKARSGLRGSLDVFASLLQGNFMP